MRAVKIATAFLSSLFLADTVDAQVVSIPNQAANNLLSARNPEGDFPVVGRGKDGIHLAGDDWKLFAQARGYSADFALLEVSQDTLGAHLRTRCWTWSSMELGCKRFCRKASQRKDR